MSIGSARALENGNASTCVNNARIGRTREVENRNTSACQYDISIGFARAIENRNISSVGPRIIESPQEEKRVSTGVLYVLNDPFLVQTKF